MKNKKWITGIAAAIGLGLLLPGLSAQDNKYGMIFAVKSHPDKELELYEAIKEHAEWREGQGDPWDWHVYQQIVGEELGTYHIGSWNHELSCMDDYQEFLGKGHVEWSRKVMPFVASETNVITEADYSISNWPEDTATDYVLVIDYTIKPGHMWKFKESVKAVHETVLDEEHPILYSFSTVFAGSTGNVISLAIPGESMKDLAGPQEDVYELMVRVHGEEKANQVFADMNSTIHETKTFIVKKLHDIVVEAAE